MSENFDEFEKRLGGISRYQLAIIFLVGVGIFGSSSMSQSAVFLSAVPEYRCNFGEYEKLLANLTPKAISSSLIPPKDPCHRYAYNISECTISDDAIVCAENLTDVGVRECDDGYVYDKTNFRSTTVTEWDLVCKKTTLDALANSLYFVGMFVGSFAVGMLLDWFGRKRALLLLAILFPTSGILSSYSPSYLIYLATRVALAFSRISFFIAYFTYATEVGGRRYRLHAGVYAMLTTALDHTLFPVIAYFLNDWRHLCLTVSVVPLFICIIYPLLPESPRWLLARGRALEAKMVMKRFFRSKGVKFPEESWSTVVRREKELCAIEKQTKVFISDLFRTPRFRLVTTIVIIYWATSSMVYYGLVLNIGTLFGDPYVNRVCNGFAEFIGYGLSMILAKYLGRKLSLCFGLTVAGLCCISSMLLKEFANEALWILQLSRWAGILGKLFSTLAFGLAYQHTAEAYPTIARGTAISLGSMFARIGSIIIPWTLELRHSYPWLTQTTFGTISLFAGAVSFLLPETQGSEMTTTLHEANEFYKREMHLANRLFFREASPIVGDGRGRKLLHAKSNVDENFLHRLDTQSTL